MSYSKQSKNQFIQKNGDYKTSFQETVKAVGGEWFIDKINVNIPPMKKRLLSKNEQIKEDKIKEIIGRPIIVGMIGSSNCIGIGLNG